MEESPADEERTAALDKKIGQLEQQIAQKHREYDTLTAELKDLLDERYPERKADRVKDELYRAYIKSEKTLDECIGLMLNHDIMDYI